MNQGVIFHCPRCGGAIHVSPVVDQVSFHSDWMRVTFRHHDQPHECEDGDRT